MGRQASVIARTPDLNLQSQTRFPRERRSSGVAQLNEQTGCFEYYGRLASKPLDPSSQLTSRS